MKSVKISDCEFERRDGYERSIVFSSEDFSNNTKVQLMKLATGQTIKPHHHNKRTECFKIVSGTGEIRINGRVCSNRNDTLLLCQPNDIHEFINKSDTEPFIVMVIRTNDSGETDMIWQK